MSHLQQQAHTHALPRLTLSFGIVQMRRGESIDETLHRADLALYEAKRLGRSRAVAADGDPEQPVFRSSERLGLTSSELKKWQGQARRLALLVGWRYSVDLANAVSLQCIAI